MSVRATVRPRRRLSTLLARGTAIGCAALSAWFASPVAAEQSKPPAAARPWNVVLITVDALRADRMSLYGNPRRTTPQIDAFAREAAVFEKFYAVSPHTSPGIASLVTGQDPPVHAQTTRYSYYDPLIPSPLRALAARGYDVVGHAVRGPTLDGLGFTRGQRDEPTEALLAGLATRGQPFFAWLHTRETHLPYRPDAAHAGRYTGAGAPSSPLLRAVREFTFVVRDPPEEFPYPHAGRVAARAADVEPLRALYDECVASADARVGGWLARLRALGLLEQTIVVITADHGEELLDHGWVGHASTGYDAKLEDALLHVPFVLRIPGGAHAGRYAALASQVDLMPTLFELLGIDDRELSANQQGVSLLPVLRGERSEVRERVFAETTRKGWTTPPDETRDRLAAVRSDGEWRRVPEDVRDGHRAAASRIARGAATAHLERLERAVDHDDVREAIAQWRAIAQVHATYGYEASPFYADDPDWRHLRELAADLVARVLRCEARNLPTASAACQALR